MSRGKGLEVGKQSQELRRGCDEMRPTLENIDHRSLFLIVFPVAMAIFSAIQANPSCAPQISSADFSNSQSVMP